MTDHTLPDAGTHVELTALDGSPVAGVRVVAADGVTVTLSLALAAVPPAGETVTLRWPAGERGRYALTATVAGVDENRVQLAAAGGPAIEQLREYVRGGGGEPVLLRRTGHPDTPGWIRDLSEQSVRAHFEGVELAEGDEVRLRVHLDGTPMEVAAVITRAGAMRQTVPEPGPMSVEVVAVLGTDEAQARTIRRYIFQQQMLTRTRLG